jgi:hypothetical protein
MVEHEGGLPMKFLFVGLWLLITCVLASAQGVPLPPTKPPSLQAAHPPSPHDVLPQHDARAWPSDCSLRLAEIARFAHRPTENGPGQCGAADLVRLEGIVMPNGALVSMIPPAILRCPMAQAVAQWVQNDLGPASNGLKSPPVAITNAGSYECRGRNNDSNGKVSEHGRANALDLGAIRLANGAVIDLSNASAPPSFRQHLREAACRRFTTVLGPGSDPYHANHIHLDLIERARGYRICQWDVEAREAANEVPLPPPNPLRVERRR